MRTQHLTRWSAVLAGLFLASIAPCADQVPHLLHHQGRIIVDGVNFDGSGQFKFAFVDAGNDVAQQATASLTINSGFITGATVMAPGLGYTTPPTVTVNATTGSGAVLQAVVTGGAVSAINVINPGSGYGLDAVASIAPPPPSWVFQEYWMNAPDTAPNDGEPDAGVTLNVTNGLYEVLLGDNLVANMDSIPSTVFTNPDVRLRVWFNDGTHGFQLLSPDKRIAAVGYTLMAENVQDGAITREKIAAGAVGSTQLGTSAVQAANIASSAVTSSKIANGAVGNAQIAAGAVGSGNIASNAVGSSQIISGAVGSSQIADNTIAVADIGTAAVGSDELAANAVIAGKIAANAVGTGNIVDGAVTSGKIAANAIGTSLILDGSITTADLANGAVDNSKLASSAVQTSNIQNYAVTQVKLAFNSVGFENLIDSAVGTQKLMDDAVTASKIHPKTITAAEIANGTITATQIANNTITATQLAKPPRSGSVSSSSLTLQFNQAPFEVSFPTSFSTTPIVTVAARNDSGSAWSPSTWVTSTTTTGFSGLLSIPVAPLTVDSDDNVGQYVSHAIVSSNPALAYYDATSSALVFLRANDVNGASWGTPLPLDITGTVGLYPSLAVVSSNPAIAYYDASNGDLKYVRANNPAGSAWFTSVTVDSGGAGLANVGKYASLVVVNGNPAIAYYDQTNGDLKFVRATEATGSAWGTPQVLDSTGDVGRGIAMAIVSSNPAIAYGDFTGSSYPKFIRASTTSGTGSWNSPVTLSDAGAGELIAEKVCLAVVNGNPAVAYWDNTIGGARYLRATSSTGATWPTSWTRLDSGTGTSPGSGVSLMVVSSRPAVSFYESGNLHYLRADDASGTTWGRPVIVDSSGRVGEYTSMIMVNSQPAIAYYDESFANLLYVRAPALPSTFSIGWIAIEP